MKNKIAKIETVTQKKLSTELVGVSDSKAKQIRDTFEPMVAMLDSFEAQCDAILAQEKTIVSCAEAKGLRLKIAKIRTSADKEKKKMKEEYLRGGNAVQGAFNILKYAVIDREEKLKLFEDYFIIEEQKRVDALRAERQIELGKLEYVNDLLDVGAMADDAWQIFLVGIKTTHDAKIKAEKDAEANRLHAEQKAQKERDLLKKENARLLAEQKAKDAVRAKEKAAADKAQAKIDAENAAVLEKVKAEEERLRIQQEEIDADRQALLDEEDRLLAEKKAKQAAFIEAEKTKTDIDRIHRLIIVLEAELELLTSEQAIDAVQFSLMELRGVK